LKKKRNREFFRNRPPVIFRVHRSTYLVSVAPAWRRAMASPGAHPPAGGAAGASTGHS